MKEKTQARLEKYFIPAKLAGNLWEFEEGTLVSRMLADFQAWEEDKLSDKTFAARMAEYLSLLEEFRGAVLSGALAKAIYDGQGNDIEWTEPLAESEFGTTRPNDPKGGAIT